MARQKRLDANVTIPAHTSLSYKQPGLSDEQIADQPADKQSQCAAGQREQRAFGEQLTRDATTAGAESVAHRQLPFASDDAREREIGNIRSDEQQDKPRGGQQDEQGGSRLASQLVVDRERRCGEAAMGGVVRLRILRAQPAVDDGEVVLRAFYRDSRFQAADSRQHARRPVGDRLRVRAKRTGRRRHEEVVGWIHRRELGNGREHADDSRRFVV